jgi:hypothetical protein
MTIAVNLMLYQAGWFACVLGAATGLALATIGIGRAILAPVLFGVARHLDGCACS